METKQCPYCKSSISPAAIKCPNCREWLNTKSLSYRNPFFFPVLLIVSGFSLSAIYQNRISNNLKDLMKNPITYSSNSKLTIKDPQFLNDDLGPRVIGTITNDEDFNWDSVTVLVTFKDKDDKVIYLADTFVNNLKTKSTRKFQSRSISCDEKQNFSYIKNFDVSIETATAQRSK